MSDYENMSDFEINKRVAVFRGGYLGQVGDWNPNAVQEADETGLFHYERDYCNKPSDAWPIIVDNRIDIDFPDEFGYAPGSATKFIDGDTNAQECFQTPEEALRAAMIVFLMVKEQS